MRRTRSWLRAWISSTKRGTALNHGRATRALPTRSGTRPRVDNEFRSPIQNCEGNEEALFDFEEEIIAAEQDGNIDPVFLAEKHC